MRYIVEGRWSQSWNLCHRVVVTRPKLVEWFCGLTYEFGDHTRLSISVRPAVRREQVQEIRGYTELLDKLYYLGLSGYVKEADLIAKEKEAGHAAESH